MKNIRIKIKKAEVQDIPVILKLMEEFSKFVNLSEYLEVTQEQLTEVMSGDDALLKGLIALDDQTPVAYAFFYQTFASFRGQKSVYLEDIFIAGKYRKSGIGERMLRELQGLESNPVRPEWTWKCCNGISPL